MKARTGVAAALTWRMHRAIQSALVFSFTCVLALVPLQVRAGEPTLTARRVKTVDLSQIPVPVYNCISFDVDSFCNLYLASIDNCQVVVLDSAGSLVRTIGNKGEGPGEFLQPAVVEVVADTALVVSDYSSFRLSLFSTNGVFLRSVAVSMGPLLSWSGKFLCANSVRSEYLVDLYDASLKYLRSIGDGRLAPLMERLGPGLLLESYQDTIWVVHWRKRPLLLTKWSRDGTLLFQTEITTPTMRKNIAAKDEQIREESKRLRQRGLSVGGGEWQHIDALRRDSHGRLWFSYNWFDAPGKLRTVFYVFSPSMRLICRVEGFSTLTDCPRFDRQGRLWVLEQPESPEGALRLSVYEVPISTTR